MTFTLSPAERLTEWEIETQRLAEYFVKRYFGKDAECYWIADDVGGCLEVADRFFSLSDIVEFIKHKYTYKQLAEYYDYRMDEGMKKNPKPPICIRDWKRLQPKGK